MRGRVLGVVGRGDQRPPAGLLDRRRVAVVEAGRGAEAVAGHRRRVDRGHRPPEQVVVLRVHHGDHRVGADLVDHREQPRGLRHVEAHACVAMLRARPLYWRTTFAVQKSAIVGLVRRPRRARGGAERLDLVERGHPLRARQRRRRRGPELVGALEHERPHVRHPRRLRGRVGAWRQPPHARARAAASGTARSRRSASAVRRRRGRAAPCLAASPPCSIPLRFAGPAGIAASAASWRAVRSGSFAPGSSGRGSGRRPR